MATIEYRPLGSSGLMVSTVGLGCNNFGRPKTVTESQAGTNAVIGAALDAGVTLFDTADIYGGSRGLSETLMGVLLKGRRDEIVLATKFGMDMAGANGPDWGARGSRRYVRLAVLDDLITEGKVRYIGHSNLAGWQITDADYRATLGRHPHFISAQNEQPTGRHPTRGARRRPVGRDGCLPGLLR